MGPLFDSHVMTFTYRKHPHLYEINTWAWLDALSRKRGQEVRLRDIPDQEWDTLQAHGFDFLWLMGIWQRSPESQRIARTEQALFASYDRALPDWKPDDIIGSPYAVRAYEPDARIGNWHDLDTTRKKLHQRGMGLILDFVPNHTARDHAWIRSNPALYIQGTSQRLGQTPKQFFQPLTDEPGLVIAHGKDPFFPPWTDTAQLNYLNPATREAMLGELRTIANHCDGVRCDMAMLVLHRILGQTWESLLEGFPIPSQEFWTEARKALPHFILIAEVYWDLEWELQQLGFDFTYDKRLYDRLRRTNAQGIRDHLSANLSFQTRLVRFLENHDEARSAEAFGVNYLQAPLTLISTLPGMRLYHQGQLEGHRIHLPVQLPRTKPEMTNPQIHQLHETILTIANTPIFHEGHWEGLQVGSDQNDSYQNLIAYSWQLEDDLRLVLVNVSSSPAQGRIVLHPPQTNAKEVVTYIFEDLFTKNRIRISRQNLGEEGLVVRVNSFGSAIFSCLVHDS